MAKNNNKHNGVIELWGHEFKKAGEGLDRGQVESFIEELMKKHEALLKRTEHLTSLTKLAEKTIVEADTVAKQVRGEAEEKANEEAKVILSEAEEKAKTEAKAILSEAEEKGQKLAEGKKAEVLAKVEQEVEAIKAKAQQEAEKMLEEKAKEIQPELRKNAKRLYEELTSQLEGLKQQVAAFEKELDQKLALPPEKASAPVEETSPVNDKAGPVDEKAGQADEKASPAEEETSQTDNEFLELFQPASDSDDQPEWELEILPPIDLTQILDIINYLDDQPEVQQTELIPHMERPKITVFLNKPIAMINVLKGLPQVAQVTEDNAGSNGSDVKPRKVKIELSRRTAPRSSN
jgi:vacuolar-type H+-ATPase subunit H